MECKENDIESKDIQITDDNIKISTYLNGEKYLLNINSSRDNINIIFKIEKEKIQTYYFSSKFDLKDFKRINKIFIIDNNIHNIFLHLKHICKKSIFNLELTKKGNKIFIIFQNEEKKNIKFSLLKKLVSQEKINPILDEQICDNKLKLNKLKNQIREMDKSLNLKNDLIKCINSKISNLNEIIENISIINSNNNLNLNANSNSISTKNSSTETNSNSENNSCNNNSVNNNEEEFQEGKKENNLMDKDKEKNIKNNNKDNPNAFFCYDSSQNKKIIEFLIILNVVTISIVLYIIGTNYNLRINLEFDPVDEEDNRNRLAYLSFMDNSRNSENFRDIFKENLEVQKNKEEGITNTKMKDEYIENRKKKLQERIYNYYDYL
jgi:hypothetical protein